MPIEQDSFISELNALDFSDSNKQLDELKHIILNAAETSSTKIEFIKEEILAGTFQIHSNHIAEKMLEYMPLNEEALEIA